MGSEESKAYIEHNGDSHIDIIKMQSEHSEKFEENKLMLQIIPTSNSSKRKHRKGQKNWSVSQRDREKPL